MTTYIKSPTEKKWHIARPTNEWTSANYAVFSTDEDWVTRCGSSRPLKDDGVCTLPGEIALVRTTKPRRQTICKNCTRGQ